MERFRRFIRNWLGFSRTETNAFIIFLPLLLLLILARPAYRTYVSNDRSNSLDSIYLDSLVRSWNEDLAKMQVESVEHELFSFDPNKVTENDMLRLGFTKHLTTRIAGYRSKGGVFRVKRDLLKIYGMDSTLYEQLHAYISLPEKAEEKRLTKNDGAKKSETRLSFEKKQQIKFDLNTADTMQLKQVYGIGDALSLRIVKFRDALGGFTTQNQLREVYGLDSAVVQRLSHFTYVSDGFVPAKININTADEKMLAAHPYIKRSAARAIVSFRFQHGNFKETDDIKKIAAIPPHQAEKLLPYLTVTD